MNRVGYTGVPRDMKTPFPLFALLVLGLTAAASAQVPPPESGAPGQPTPGAGQARRELQPPSGAASPSPFPGATPPAATTSEATAPTAVNARLPQLGVGSLNIDALAAGGVDEALDPQGAMAAFNQASRSEQDVARADLRTRVDATRRALLELTARSRAQGVAVDSTQQGRMEAELEEREEVLKRTLGTTPVAQTDDEWRRLQAEVSTHYDAFANAVRRVQMNLQSQKADIPAER
jgi:hypothetical protein